MSERLRRQAGVLVQEAHGQTVLLRVDDGSYYTLDEVGAVIWELCDGSRTTGEIVDAVCDAFDGPPEQVGSDVLDFVTELLAERLLDRVT
jgi:hypothetical protein